VANPQWVEISTGVSGFAQAAALLVGGVWAYYKFARGRTLAWRLELEADGQLLGDDGHRAVRVRLTLRNPGLSIVRLSDLKQIRLYGLSTSGWDPDRWADWGDPLTLAEIFAEHACVESQETVEDDVLLLVPSPPAEADWLAFRVVALVVGASRPRHDAMQWTATAVIPAQAAQIDQDRGTTNGDVPSVPTAGYETGAGEAPQRDGRAAKA
jgi:hypothetical protein